MYFHVRIASAMILIFLSGNNGLSIRLSALRPDLECLRGYWLQNPSEKNREGRIIFSNHTQILVDFEKSLNPIQDAAWSKDFLRLRGIHEMPTSSPVTAIDDLYYKHSTFYVRRNPYTIPESLPEGRRDWITTLPIDAGDDAASVEINYLNLNNLATNIEVKIAEIDSTATRNMFIPLKNGEDEFPFDFVKSRTHLFVRHARIIEFVHVQRRPPESTPHGSEDEVSDYVNYIRSEETPFIRYDRHAKSFYSVGNELLDHRSYIRSSVGNYTLRGS